mgnify:CR=1 FL=1
MKKVDLRLPGGDSSVAAILDERPVRLIQEQWFYLMSLGGEKWT